jgi:ketosteroid isomerase-like protein
MLTLLLLLAIHTADPEAAKIRAVLDAQVAAWNRGDLEAYMAGYWHSPDLEFYSGATITRGWQPTLDRYRSRYQAAGKEMGHLTFDGVAIDVLSPTTATARGAWRLQMKQGDPPHGLFTLILRKFPEGWRIVHDHSS